MNSDLEVIILNWWFEFSFQYISFSTFQNDPLMSVLIEAPFRYL